MDKRIEDIYNLFKPMPETKVWGDGNSVCVSWENTSGYMRWLIKNGELKFVYVTD